MLNWRNDSGVRVWALASGSSLSDVQHGSFIWEVVKAIKRLCSKPELYLKGWLGGSALTGLRGAAAPPPSGTCCSEEPAVCLTLL